jgi:hypothetical protein
MLVFKGISRGRFPFRTAWMTSAFLGAAAGLLHAASSPWALQAGLAVPTGGGERWVGSNPAPTLDLIKSFDLPSDDTLRFRLGYFGFSAKRNDPQNLSLPPASNSFPASTTNQLIGFSYGVEYLHLLTRNIYGLGGAGLAYLTASRSGTVDLTSASLGPTSFNYSAAKVVPYICLGTGYRFTQSLALEGRFQFSTMEGQVRPASFPNGFSPSPKANFPGLTTPTLSLGLVLGF